MAEARKKSRLSRAIAKAKQLKEEQADSLDEAIQEIEKEMRPYLELQEHLGSLRKARNALVGGNALTGSGTTRVTLQALVDYVTRNEGETPSQIAEYFGATVNTINNHISRHQDRFIRKNSKIYLRDPEAGVNTASDIPEDEEDEEE